VNKSVPPPSASTWRVLILDPDPADPVWLLCTVLEPADVRPAGDGEAMLDEVTAAWVRARVGGPAALTAMPRALTWRVDERQ
jgi:hypothetical protein